MGTSATHRGQVDEEWYYLGIRKAIAKKTDVENPQLCKCEITSLLTFGFSLWDTGNSGEHNELWVPQRAEAQGNSR